MRGVCPKCWEVKELRQYRIYPPKYFGQSEFSLYICRHCKERIDQLILGYTGAKKKENFMRIARNFMTL